MEEKVGSADIWRHRDVGIFSPTCYVPLENKKPNVICGLLCA